MEKWEKIFKLNHISEELTPREVEELKAFKQLMTSCINTFSVKKIHNMVYSINGTFDRDHNVERNKSLYDIRYTNLLYFHSPLYYKLLHT